MLTNLVDRLWGPWCLAVDPEGNATCWTQISDDQPAGICDDCWKTLVRQGTLTQRAELARHDELPAGWEVELAADPHPLVRSLVAERDGLGYDCRTLLIRSDEDDGVLRKVARRDDLTMAEQRTVLHCSDVVSLRLLAGNPNTHAEIRKMLAAHPDVGVRKACVAAEERLLG